MQTEDTAGAVLTFVSGALGVIQGAEARRSVEIIRAIYRSAQSQQPVRLPLVDD